MNSELKLCANCLYVSMFNCKKVLSHWKCLSPHIPMSPLNGEQMVFDCVGTRGLANLCGPDGDWWVADKNFKQKEQNNG